MMGVIYNSISIAVFYCLFCSVLYPVVVGLDTWTVKKMMAAKEPFEKTVEEEAPSDQEV